MKEANKFEVGDGVHWNAGSDTYAGVVVKATGARVHVALSDLDTAKLGVRMLQDRFREGEPNVSWTDGKVATMVFTRRDDFTFRRTGGQSILHHGRVWYWDPSF